MSTSANAIANALKTALDAKGFDRTDPHSKMDDFVDAFAAALYGELQNLEDTAGDPPSPAHQ